uniref:translation initiation factor IF-2-like n=1 Tax=Callithrix jacchus TaxID=9483 RepID=UPI0023DCF4A9|nr:translation initiation factor IF-2-like [Callithrix jacchus]
MAVPACPKLTTGQGSLGDKSAFVVDEVSPVLPRKSPWLPQTEENSRVPGAQKKVMSKLTKADDSDLWPSLKGSQISGSAGTGQTISLCSGSAPPEGPGDWLADVWTPRFAGKGAGCPVLPSAPPASFSVPSPGPAFRPLLSAPRPGWGGAGRARPGLSLRGGSPHPPPSGPSELRPTRPRGASLAAAATARALHSGASLRALGAPWPAGPRWRCCCSSACSALWWPPRIMILIHLMPSVTMKTRKPHLPPSPVLGKTSTCDALGGGGHNGPAPPNPPKPRPNPNPNQPASTGSFSDADLADGVPAGEGTGGRHGGGSQGNEGEQADTPGVIPGIVGAIVVAVAGAISSFIAYQKKKLCFKEQ